MSRQSILAAALAAAFLAGCSTTVGVAPAASSDGHWVASWGTAQMVPDPNNELAPAQWRDATLRQVVRVSNGGGAVRVKLSTVMGAAPLVIDGASVALSAGPGHAALDPASLHALRFGGSTSVTIPGGAEYLSDPVELTVPAGADLAT